MGGSISSARFCILYFRNDSSRTARYEIMNDLDKLTIYQLEEIIIDLLARRTQGTMSPGEYRARAIDVVDAYYKKLREEQTKHNDNYDRAMGVV